MSSGEKKLDEEAKAAEMREREEKAKAEGWVFRFCRGLIIIRSRRRTLRHTDSPLVNRFARA